MRPGTTRGMVAEEDVCWRTCSICLVVKYRRKKLGYLARYLLVRKLKCLFTQGALRLGHTLLYS